MTELERQLTRALTALSEQYEREQMQRLEEAVKNLQPQLGRNAGLAEDLKEQVELLAADYREIAAGLSGS